MNDEIILERHEGIAILRFNRPHARNALNWAAQEQFAAHIADLAGDEQARVLILTGADGAFVAGGDLKELAQGNLAANGQRLSRLMTGALAQMVRLPIPVIAAINGHAVGGGCEILLACDLRLAAKDARLDFAQVRLGLTTGWGGAARLCALLGRSRAAEILLRGRTLSAAEAHQIGLLHAVAGEGDDVLALARRWAEQLVALPQEALAAMKQLLYTMTAREEGEVMELERQLFNQLWGAPAHRAALEKFLEKGFADVRDRGGRGDDVAGHAHAAEGDTGG